MNWLRRLLILPPLLAGVGLVAYAVSGRQPPETVAIEETRTPVRVIEARLLPFLPRVTGYGVVEPAKTWNAVAQVDGRVAEINPAFIRGGTVAAGDVLVRIAADDYELAIAQSRAEIASIEAELTQTRQTEQTINASLRIEEETLKLTERDLQRQQNLVANNVTAASTVDERERAMLAQKFKVQELRNQLTLLPSSIQALEQSRAVAEASLKVAELDLERTVIRAPFDGRVAEMSIELSQYVATGTDMGRLDGIASAEIDVQIPPSLMSGFVRLSIQGLPTPSQSSVQQIPAGQVPASGGFECQGQTRLSC